MCALSIKCQRSFYRKKTDTSYSSLSISFYFSFLPAFIPLVFCTHSKLVSHVAVINVYSLVPFKYINGIGYEIVNIKGRNVSWDRKTLSATEQESAWRTNATARTSKKKKLKRKCHILWGLNCNTMRMWSNGISISLWRKYRCAIWPAAHCYDPYIHIVTVKTKIINCYLAK